VRTVNPRLSNGSSENKCKANFLKTRTVTKTTVLIPVKQWLRMGRQAS
jgi:hypothetical protein